MKNYIIFFVLVIGLFLNHKGYGQSEKLYVEAYGTFFLPTGTLADRFKNGMGGTFSIGYPSGDNWIISGKFDVARLKENRDKFILNKKIVVNNVEKVYSVPLTSLTTDLNFYGLSVNASYKIFQNNIFNSTANAGFGIFYWTSLRSAYFDTLRVDTGGSSLVNLAIIKVPELRQDDWSGGFNAGVDFGVKIIEPVWIKFGASYKIIIGELWPSLEVNLDNISTFQMFEFKAGLQIVL